MAAPAPAVVPFSAATIGAGSARMARISSQVMRVNSSSAAASRPSSGPMISRTSPPVQKARPSPVMTTARTAGRAASARKVSVSSRYTSNVSAFICSGRSSVRVATPSASA